MSGGPAAGRTPGADGLGVLDAFGFEAAAIVLGPEGVRASAGDLEKVRPLRSVSKTLTGFACAIALERGAVALTDPVGPEGSTLRHVLCHASGLFYESDRVLQEPGKRRHYSNRGIDVAALHVARAVGRDFEDWVSGEIAEPLGMERLSWDGPPSVGAFAPLADLALLALELLRPTLLGPEVFAQMTTPQLPGLVGIMPGFGKQDPNPFGLGFEVRGAKSPHWTGTTSSPETFGHFGMLGTALWVDPVADLAAVIGTDHEFCDTHRELLPRLSDDILARWAPPAR
ncbi:serine hydrolase domain-containing protein [Brachybacterium kimchii]|uniref:Beta-lactamase family protein n=1 Tax=Brachybacterium kimchii TaxID=2942909 RepID=A0ABY4N6U7_9MICO|nr:serine hydrolase domain-containing protein [Brachybacterium kimchii]UQN29561.1 beta-lactamase family protein [Brachybacterium kimchii]